MQPSIGEADIENYAVQFDEKIARTEEDMKVFSPPKLECFTSPAEHFRMRAEFKVWHEDGAASYAMYEPGRYKKPIKISNFSIGSKTICSLMPKLLEAINADKQLKSRLFQVEFLSSSLGNCVITLIYHKKLDESWQLAAEPLEKALGCCIIGRSRGQKVVLSQDFILEEFAINAKTYRYQQVETGFTQPNAAVCKHMLEWAQNVTTDLPGDLLELYCGNGNFTLPLAENFTKVLATEISKTSVRSALHNFELNNARNIAIARMSSEEFTEAMQGKREFHRLRDIDLGDYDFSTVFVDPPRAGLDQQTTDMVAQFDNILYISCNPESLKTNLDQLTKSHTIRRFAFFDQFPYTDHRECGVLLCRN